MTFLSKSFFFWILSELFLLSCTAYTQAEKNRDSFKVYSIRKEMKREKYVQMHYSHKFFLGIVPDIDWKEKDLCPEGSTLESICFSEFISIVCGMTIGVYCPVYFGAVCRK